jgi:hypothetical protein
MTFCKPERILHQTTLTAHLELQGHRVISERSAEIVSRWILHQTTLTKHLELQGHRVISKRSAEIVSRWMLHKTRNLLHTRTSPILKCLARTSSDFCAKRRNSIEMDTTSNHPHNASRYYLVPTSPNHSMTFCIPEEKLHQTTLTTHLELQGHRVISKRSAEIVSRWVLHKTRNLLQTRISPILKCPARTSSDFGAQRRNSIEMDAT